MRRMTTRRIRRLLAAGGTPDPPAGLVDRIKAEIPEVLQVGGAALGPAGVRGMPARVPPLRPLWLLAASLLVVIGAGFVAVRFFTPATDFAREIALGGVVRIEDIVVTVPERSTVEGRKPASAASALPEPAAATGVGTARVAAKNGRRLAGATSRGASPVVVGEQRLSEPEPAERSDERGATGAMKAAPAFEAEARNDAVSLQRAGGKGSIVVTVRDADGQPVPGALLTLVLADRPDVQRGSRVTGSAGVAMFCCVSPGAYRVCAQLEGFTAAVRDGLELSDGRQLEISLTLGRVPASGPQPPWTCPTPPSAPR